MLKKLAALLRKLADKLDPKPTAENVSDKMLHAAAGAVAAAVGLLSVGPGAALILAALAGIARELWNWQIQGTRWDWLDLLATVAGGVALVAANAAFA